MVLSLSVRAEVPEDPVGLFSRGIGSASSCCLLLLLEIRKKAIPATAPTPTTAPTIAPIRTPPLPFDFFPVDEGEDVVSTSEEEDGEKEGEILVLAVADAEMVPLGIGLVEGDWVGEGLKVELGKKGEGDGVFEGAPL